MIYELSGIPNGSAGYTALASFAATTKELLFDHLAIDFTNCGFFAANLAAPLGAIIAKIADSENSITIKNLRDDVRTILCKNRFLLNYGFKELADVNNTTLPFVKFQPGQQKYFVDYLSQNLRGRGMPAMTDGFEKKLRMSVLEVFDNAAIHSKSKLGVHACGQYFPNKNRLYFTISDSGVGIRHNVRSYLGAQNITAEYAIEWALISGNTTRVGAQPGGLGLKFLKDFVGKNGGRIEIASDNAYYVFSKNSENYSTLSQSLPGTTVTLQINTSDTGAYRLVDGAT